jgi:hypothetical protein
MDIGQDMLPRYRSPFGILDFVHALVRDGESSPTDIAHGQQMSLMPSASDCLYHTLRHIRPVGSVTLPAYTCFKVVRAIQAANWQPIFVDIDLATGAMLHEDVAKTLDRQQGAKVLLLTHLHGVPNDMAPLVCAARNAGAVIVEDCAMAQGALHQGKLVGSLGDWAIYSFGLGKVLSLGAGGALTVNATLASSLQMMEFRSTNFFRKILSRTGSLGHLRFHAQETIKRLVPGLATTNPEHAAEFIAADLSPLATRVLTTLLASTKTKKFIDEQRKRSVEWLHFINELRCTKVSMFIPVEGDTPCFPGVPLIVKDRDALQRALRVVGVDSARYFDYCAAHLSGDQGSFLNSEFLAKHSLIIPLYSTSKDTANKIRRVIYEYAKAP